MSDLTEKQRAALVALRDVMKEHEIRFSGDCVGHGVLLEVEGCGLINGYLIFNSDDAFQLLEQHKEPPQDPPGFEGTMDKLNKLRIRK